MKTANERKAQLRAQKELERHNKELEKQISGSGVQSSAALRRSGQRRIAYTTVVP